MRIMGFGIIGIALLLILAGCGAADGGMDFEQDYQLFQWGYLLDADQLFINLTMQKEHLVVNSTDGIVSVARIDGGLLKILHVVIDKNGDRHLRNTQALAVFFATGGENISDQLSVPLYFGRYPGLDLVSSIDRSGNRVAEAFLNRAGVRIQQAGDYTMFYDARENKLWHFGIVNEDGSLTEMTSDSLLGVSAFINATYTYEKIVKECDCD